MDTDMGEQVVLDSVLDQTEDAAPAAAANGASDSPADASAATAAAASGGAQNGDSEKTDEKSESGKKGAGGKMQRKKMRAGAPGRLGMMRQLARGSPRRPVSLSGGKFHKVLLGNVPYEANWKDVKDLVRQTAGDVANVEVICSPDGQSFGFALAEFREKEQATNCIEKMNGAQLNGRKLRVKEFTKADEERFERMAQRAIAAAPQRGGPMRPSAPTITAFARPGPQVPMYADAGFRTAAPGAPQFGFGGPAEYGGQGSFGASGGFGGPAEYGRQGSFGSPAGGFGAPPAYNRPAVVGAPGAFGGVDSFGGFGGYQQDRGARGALPPSDPYADPFAPPPGHQQQMYPPNSGQSPMSGAPVASALTGVAGGPVMERAVATMRSERVLSEQQLAQLGISSEQLKRLGVEFEGFLTCQVFVGNLPYAVTADAIRDTFSFAGSVQYVRLPMKDGRPAGWGIVHYFNIMDALNAIQSFNGKNVFGRELHVRVYVPDELGGATWRQNLKRAADAADPARHPTAPLPTGGAAAVAPVKEEGSCKVIVKNVPSSYDAVDLKASFREAGGVLDAEMLRDAHGRPMGVARVRFVSHADALRAKRLLDGARLDNEQIVVDLE